MSTVEIRLDRISKTFQQGEIVKGQAFVEGTEIHCLTLSLLGTVRTCPRSSLDDLSQPKVEQEVIRLRKKLRNSEVTDGISVFRFEIVLAPDKSTSKRVEVLPETYHGEMVEVKYHIEATLSRGYFSAPLKAETEIIVVFKSALSSCPKNDAAQNFQISHENSTKRLSGENQESIRVTRFKFNVRIKSTQCALVKPLEGVISLQESTEPVKSVEAKLTRVESVLGGRGHERSEVMSLEVVHGDSAKEETVPFAIYFPKYLTCATLRGLTAKITTQWGFRVEFEVNFVIHFENESFTSKPVSLDLFRHKWKIIA